MGPTEHEELLSLRRQCRWAAVAAVLLLTVGMATAMPAALKRRRTLKAANEEVVRLQASVVDTQNQIREIQRRIVVARTQIREVLNGNN